MIKSGSTRQLHRYQIRICSKKNFGQVPSRHYRSYVLDLVEIQPCPPPDSKKNHPLTLPTRDEHPAQSELTRFSLMVCTKIDEKKISPKLVRYIARKKSHQIGEFLPVCYLLATYILFFHMHINFIFMVQYAHNFNFHGLMCA